MTKFFLRAAFMTIIICSSFPSILHAASFYDFKYTDTNKKELPFSELKGKVVIVVNIATRCGFTGQLDDLEKLYQTYKDKNFIILGFPSNDFLSQTPESNEEVAKFCRLKYGATFPIFEKQVVKGKDKNDLYKWLTSDKKFGGEIGWNFTKFIINKEGVIVERFMPITNPLDKDVKASIEKAL